MANWERLVWTTAVSALVFFSSGECASAQMFGPRTLGGSVGPKNAQQLEDIGSLEGNERFIRGRHKPTDIVGATRAAIQSFVGIQQGTQQGTVRPATTGLREDPTRDVNRVQPEPGNARTRMYRPRLSIGFTVPASNRAEVSAALSRRLAQRLAVPGAEQIRVTLTGGKAILEGEVASDHAREVAELMVLLEPGVDEIQNLLTVPQPPDALLPELP